MSATAIRTPTMATKATHAIRSLILYPLSESRHSVGGSPSLLKTPVAATQVNTIIMTGLIVYVKRPCNPLICKRIFTRIL